MCSFTGLSLLGVSAKMGINLSAMHALTFASLIAAVDPVAVSTLQNSLKCRGGSRGRVQGVRTPPPWDDLQFSNTTGIMQKKTMWFIGVEVEQETRAPPPKKNPGSAPGNVCIYIKNQFQLPLCQIIEVWEEAMLSVDQNKFSRLHLWCRSKNDSLNIELAPRKVSFTAWHLGNLYLGGISPKVVSVSPKKHF